MLLLNAEDFGLPQRRKRLFIIAVHRQRADDELICGADFFLLPDDDFRVLAELDRRVKSKSDREKKQAEKDAEKEEEPGDKTLECHMEKWKQLHMSIAESRKTQWPVQISSDLRNNEWFQTLPQREKEIIGFFEMTNADRKSIGNTPYRFADLYHSANRTPVSTPEVVPTILPSGTVWDDARQRLHLGVEQLALQGVQYQDATMSKLSNNQAQDLAGNGFPSFVVAALQIAILSSLEYSPTEEATMDSDLDHVNSILSRIGKRG